MMKIARRQCMGCTDKDSKVMREIKRAHHTHTHTVTTEKTNSITKTDPK
jgi:hypothetical protein